MKGLIAAQSTEIYVELRQKEQLEMPPHKKSRGHTCGSRRTLTSLLACFPINLVSHSAGPRSGQRGGGKWLTSDIPFFTRAERLTYTRGSQRPGVLHQPSAQPDVLEINGGLCTLRSCSGKLLSGQCAPAARKDLKEAQWSLER